MKRIVIEDDYHFRHRKFDIGQQDCVFKTITAHGRRRLPWTMAFIAVPTRSYDLGHFVNAVPIPALRPYVLSFEDYCPYVPDWRYYPLLEPVLMRALLSDKCRMLLPWSSYALRQATVQIARYPWAASLVGKMRIVPPSVEMRASRPRSATTPRSSCSSATSSSARAASA
jgi:hypothetical protein